MWYEFPILRSFKLCKAAVKAAVKAAFKLP